MPEGEIKYEAKTLTTLRAAEARSIAKWEKDGWELVSRTELPLLRTQLSFRRVKPKPPWRLILITVMSLITEDGDDTAQPTSSAAANPTPASSSTQPAEELPPAYSYSGPAYEIVATDTGVTAADLSQYWIFTSELDTATLAYRDQIRSIVEDMAREQGTNLFLLSVVTDKEIALAESPSNTAKFIEDYGDDYFLNTIPEKEATGWVAWYTGGFDYDASEPDESAFEIVWFPAGAEDSETWVPVVADN
jgi:hypothetical protein